MDNTTIGAVLGALFMISGGLATIYKFINTLRKERELENEKTYKQAKEYVDNKINMLESQLESEISALQAEITHQKNLHEGKLAELSEKIEHLREETRRYHGQLVELISKMVDKQ